MRSTDAINFVLLAALWGGSFLFMRIGVPEFGPFALMLMRCIIGALVLLSVCCWQVRLPALVAVAGPVTLLGIINSALPFALFGYASLTLPSGMTAVLNSTAPFFGALIAFLWLRERLAYWQLLGLLIGFCGVVVLVLGGGRLENTHVAGLVPGVVAALLAACFYGLAASFMKRYLSQLDSLVGATGSQLSASLILLLPGVLFWPAQMPSLKAWGAVIMLGVFCTALAYLLYFRLIASLGPSRAITVTFAIPVFGLFWGVVFLNESVSLLMLSGAVLVIVGCVLTTRVWPGKTASLSADGD